MAEPIDALQAEATRTGAFLAGLTAEDWQRPTRCPPLTVRELSVHALRGAYRIIEFLGAAPAEGEPEKDAVTYFRYDPVVEGPVIVSRAQAESRKRPPDAEIAAEWSKVWDRALVDARMSYADDPVVVTPFGTLRLQEYLKTRCVEVGIHTMDLRDALGLAPDPSPKCLDVVGGVLRGLLGADLRPLGMDDVRFALVGTGRAELTPAEREILGPLSDAFPLLQ